MYMYMYMLYIHVCIFMYMYMYMYIYNPTCTNVHVHACTSCPGVVERNEALSQQMVSEELARIVQSELVELRQRNIAETTNRIRLENQLGELQVMATID